MAAVGASHQDGLINEAGVVVQPSRQTQVKSAEHPSIVRVPHRHKSFPKQEGTNVNALRMAMTEYGSNASVATCSPYAALTCATIVTYTGVCALKFC